MNENTEPKTKRRIINHPASTFILLSIFVILISSIASWLGAQTTYTKINPITGELEPYIVTVTSLLNRTGLRYIISEATRNFISFAPLAISLLMLVAFGILNESGFLKTIITKINKKINKKTITFLLFLVGIILNVFMETSYLIMIPLGALIFLFIGRNPLVGIVTGFASVAFGFSINIFMTSMDISLLYYTNMAAKVIDPKYHVGLNASLFIMITAVILLAWIGTFITEKVIVKKLGKYAVEEEVEEAPQQKHKGFIYASITFIFITLIYTYMIIPGLPYSGLLLDYTEVDYIRQLLGPNSYLLDSIPFLVATIFIFTGVAYGIGAKTFKNDRDIVHAMGSYMKVFTDIVIILFFAAQFIAYFRQTNIGTVITAWGAELIKNSQFSGVPLIIISILIIAIANLFMTSTTIKWSIMSAIIVPTLMQFNITPEFSQVIVKAGDSISNGITPLLAYFVIFVAFMNYYNRDKKQPITIRKCLSYTIPYSAIYAIFWIVLIVSWYMVGLPIGPNIYPTF